MDYTEDMQGEAENVGVPDVHYKPECENRVPITVAVIALAVAVVSFFLAGQGIFYSAVFHALTLASGAVGIFFLYRYTLSYRTFHLQSVSGRRSLVVTDTQGRRISTACHLYLAECEAHYLIARGEELPAEVKAEKHKKSFNYGNTLMPRHTIRLYTETDAGRVLVTLGADEKFYRILSERIRLAKLEEETYSDASASE